MRVMILADDFFASRERSLLARLEIGLADEGVRLIHAVPNTHGDAPVGVYSKTITYSPRTLALTRPLAVRSIARGVRELDERGEDEVDLIHVFGGSAWLLGQDLAAELDAALILEVWRSGLVPRARELRRQGEAEPLLLAPDETIERALVDGATGELTVRLATWGVHAPPMPRPPAPADRARTIMVVGSGRDERSLLAAIEGIGQAAKQRGDVLIFCDAVAARRADVWPLARKHGLLDRLTLIEELEARRDLLLEGDVLVLPEAKGEQRTVLLEAFGAGMVVLAARDPMVSALRDGQTARLIEKPEPAAWRDAVLSVLGDPMQLASLTRQAHEFVRQYRRASDHVRQVLSAYEWVAGRDPLKFPAG